MPKQVNPYRHLVHENRTNKGIYIFLELPKYNGLRRTSLDVDVLANGPPLSPSKSMNKIREHSVSRTGSKAGSKTGSKVGSRTGSRAGSRRGSIEDQHLDLPNFPKDTRRQSIDVAALGATTRRKSDTPYPGRRGSSFKLK